MVYTRKEEEEGRKDAALLTGIRHYNKAMAHKFWPDKFRSLLINCLSLSARGGGGASAWSQLYYTIFSDTEHVAREQRKILFPQKRSGGGEEEGEGGRDSIQRINRLGSSSAHYSYRKEE